MKVSTAAINTAGCSRLTAKVESCIRPSTATRLIATSSLCPGCRCNRNWHCGHTQRSGAIHEFDL
jgi:hypothetical protein